MICKRGWVFTQDENGNTVPFFIKVRSDDIVNTSNDELDINNVFFKAHINDWTVDKLFSDNKESVYKLSINREASENYLSKKYIKIYIPTNEPQTEPGGAIDANFYYYYEDGRFMCNFSEDESNKITPEELQQKLSSGLVVENSNEYYITQYSNLFSADLEYHIYDYGKYRIFGNVKLDYNTRNTLNNNNLNPDAGSHLHKILVLPYQLDPEKIDSINIRMKDGTSVFSIIPNVVQTVSNIPELARTYGGGSARNLNNGIDIRLYPNIRILTSEPGDDPQYYELDADGSIDIYDEIKRNIQWNTTHTPTNTPHSDTELLRGTEFIIDIEGSWK